MTSVNFLAIPGTTALVTVDRGEPIAFVLFRRAADEVEIITIGTRPFAQRRGAARALIDRQFTELFRLRYIDLLHRSG